LSEDRVLFEKICNDLVELKDTSETMMDLAYSALLLNSSARGHGGQSPH
jgi:uncharacterized protein with PhoU and TrkA domain